VDRNPTTRYLTETPAETNHASLTLSPVTISSALRHDCFSKKDRQTGRREPCKHPPAPSLLIRYRQNPRRNRPVPTLCKLLPQWNSSDIQLRCEEFDTRTHRKTWKDRKRERGEADENTPPPRKFGHSSLPSCLLSPFHPKTGNVDRNIDTVPFSVRFAAAGGSTRAYHLIATAAERSSRPYFSHFIILFVMLCPARSAEGLH